MHSFLISETYQTSSSRPYLINSSSNKSEQLASANLMNDRLTLDLVLSNIDKRGRRHRVTRKVVDHVDRSLGWSRV